MGSADKIGSSGDGELGIAGPVHIVVQSQNLPEHEHPSSSNYSRLHFSSLRMIS